MKNLFIPPVVFVAFICLSILFFLILPEFNYIPFPLNFFGLFISLIGFTIMGKSRELFRRYDTALGFENANYLITEGIFSKTRNPMYMGMFLFLLGISLCFMNLFSQLIAFLFFFLFHFYFIPQEEKMMLDQFGQKYIDYKRNTRRWV